MFASINTQSPPIDLFPASQRVTYLYYLGRYLFSNNLFYPAQNTLQSAYFQCHKAAVRQKRLILVYLITCNIILGRFPSSGLLQRPEARDLGEVFVPICRHIAAGDIVSFRKSLSQDSPHAVWLARKGVLLQLRSRCEVLTWRSLIRRVFILDGFHGDQKDQPQKGPPPFLYLQKLSTAIQWMNSRMQPIQARNGLVPKFFGQPSFNEEPERPMNLLPLSIDWDYETEISGRFDGELNDYLQPHRHFAEDGHWVQGEVLDDPSIGEDPPDIDPFSSLHIYQEEDSELPTSLREIESIVSSLLTQDLLHGYLTHRNPRFAIPGSRIKGPLVTGFSNIWETIYTRESQDQYVPGWVQPPSLESISCGEV